ncbi:MAG: COX15/CtaA family protein, partial [Marinobacter sp.]
VACPELPTCEGQWWPEDMDFRHGFDLFQTIGPNYLGGQLTADGRIAIHVTHRLGAVIVLGYFSFLLLALWRHVRQTPARSMVFLTAAALIMQIVLGLANVAFDIPLSIAVAHNAMGAGLLLTVIHMLWQVHGYARQPVTEPVQTTNREVPA